MPWIALIGMVWGVVLGATAGPVPGAAVAGGALVLLLLRSLVQSRRSRRARAVLIARTAHGRPVPLARATDVPRPAPAPAVLAAPAFRATDELDAALLGAFWSFGAVADAALLAGCDEQEAQRRLIELLLAPRTPVVIPALADRSLSDFECRAIVRGWNSGESLDALASAFGGSPFGIGGVLLAAGPVPVGAAV